MSPTGPSPKIIEVHRTVSTVPELEAHFANEAKLGFAVSQDQQGKMRKLLALSGVVPTAGHMTAAPTRPLQAFQKRVQAAHPLPHPNTHKPTSRVVEEPVFVRSEAELHVFVLEQDEAGFPVDDGVAARSISLIRLQGWVRMVSKRTVGNVSTEVLVAT